jgi:cytochrome P450
MPFLFEETKANHSIDTTSTTLTYLFWELAKHDDWQTKLRDELKSKLAVEMHKAPPYRALASLPVLGAIIDETLRLHPAAPASLPRSTPAGGREVDGYQIPEGVSL